MLVLSRRRDESIIIGDDIVITVICVLRNSVNLEIVAPTSISVHREEIYKAIQWERKNRSTADDVQDEAFPGRPWRRQNHSERDSSAAPSTGALKLSRGRDESIIIGDDIVITVVDIRDKVRLGVKAPIEISVHRREVYEAIQREAREKKRRAQQQLGTAGG